MAGAVAKILNHIQVSGLKSGDKILPERKLAATLGLSRSSVREGIKSLNASGFIETRLGDGSYIRSKSPPPPVSKPDFADFYENPQYCLDVLEIRKSLEGNAAFDAASNADATQRLQIANAFENLIKANAANDPLSEAKYDAEFHLSIVEASHNKVLYFVYQQLFEILQSSIGNFLNTFYPSSSELNLNAQHKKIHDAIMDNDPETARDAAIEHTEHLIKTMKKSYEG